MEAATSSKTAVCPRIVITGRYGTEGLLHRKRRSLLQFAQQPARRATMGRVFWASPSGAAISLLRPGDAGYLAAARKSQAAPATRRFEHPAGEQIGRLHLGAIDMQDERAYRRLRPGALDA